MSGTVLESLRGSHEDIESIEKAIARILTERAENTRKVGRVAYDHAIAYLLKMAVSKAQTCLDIYADGDGARREELAFLMGRRPKGPDSVWANFYDQLKTVRDYHRKFAEQNAFPETRDAQYFLTMAYTGGASATEDGLLTAPKLLQGPVSKAFSPQEDMGKRVDMQGLYSVFSNMKKYRQYRETQWKQAEVARIRKKWREKKQQREEKEREEKEKKMLEDDAPMLEEEENDRRNGVNGTSHSHADEEEEMVRKKRREALWQAEEDEEIAKVAFREIDHVTWLKEFDRFHEVPRHCKYRDGDYEAYVRALGEYLQGFFQRLFPLADGRKAEEQLKADFEKRWGERTIAGWEQLTREMPLYCFPSDHLFASAQVLKGHTEGKKFKKNQELMAARSMGEQDKRREESLQADKKTAFLEAVVQKYKDFLGETIQDTVNFIQKRQSMTLQELEAAIEEEEEGGEDAPVEGVEGEEEEEVGDDDDDKPVFNPLNLPIGWDGRPMPFWLYKLNGLGQEFKCEICGNYSYWGRKNFERHFQEWRHAYGMKCIRIPNTAHFKEITKIEDAINLYEKLQKEAENTAFRPEQEIECEDSDGNVMSLRAFEDLKRQGLI
uniref:Matrin-type domain-containing protein n=1 Tax=Chromera velia CCMP2878 TaxID=1169474 RepID=A0A0G4F3S2_9ALVE|eukprot:Cvel_2734.t1-p1 / transcript=Cvel_2734.t1 / gene=Cvel_2734 / organism=Chromera_velia_CCMP2878 / gene_product=Splicing factor 3A subunit 3, putative / transcript_product=Splicing factor 3A subunit 3, putative / location=Cvel_scaffold109:74681-80346(+) / protein_length=607 / sequence_SO=supercontig / SO=protein_coding / is_pseudo=false